MTHCKEQESEREAERQIDRHRYTSVWKEQIQEKTAKLLE